MTTNDDTLLEAIEERDARKTVRDEAKAAFEESERLWRDAEQNVRNLEPPPPTLQECNAYAKRITDHSNEKKMKIQKAALGAIDAAWTGKRAAAPRG